MTFPSGPFKFNSFEEALDDLIEDWAGEESEADISDALAAKAEEMQAANAVSEERPNVEEKDQG
jgi:hypothetical protein